MKEGAGHLAIAKITRPRGNRGEVAADDLADSMRCFEPGRTVAAALPNGTERQLRIERAWRHRGRLILKFSEIGSISEAEQLRLAEIVVSRESLEPLPDGEYYLDDLVGCNVVDEATGREIGAVADVYSPPGGVLLVSVIDEERKELLVPFANDICKKVDLASGRIAVCLPEGLEELKA